MTWPHKICKLVPRPYWTQAKLAKLRGGDPRGLEEASRFVNHLLNSIDGKKKAPLFVVMNQNNFGDWIEHNILRNSKVGNMLIRHTGLPTDICKLIQQMTEGSGPIKPYLRYEYVRKFDGRTGRDFETDEVNRRWAGLDLVMFSSKVTCGLNFTAKHFARGMAYSTVNTVGALKLMQMIGRIRHYDAEVPTLFFAFNGEIRSPHLNCTGLREIREFAEKQEHFANVLRLYWGTRKLSPTEINPAKVWRDVFMFLAAQRQCLIKFPRETYSAVLAGNGWTVSVDDKPIKSYMNWDKAWYSDPPPETKYADIPTLDHMGYALIESFRGNITKEQHVSMMKYDFATEVFDLKGATPQEIDSLWEAFTETPGRCAQVALERFGSPAQTAAFDWDKRICLSTRNGSWARVRPMKHKQIVELCKAARVKNLWSRNGKEFTPEQMKAMYEWIKENAPRLKATWNLCEHKWGKVKEKWVAVKNPELRKLKRLLEAWGGYTIKQSKKTEQRANEKIPPAGKTTKEAFILWLNETGREEIFNAIPGGHTTTKRRDFIKSCKVEEKAARKKKKKAEWSYVLSALPWRFLRSKETLTQEA